MTVMGIIVGYCESDDPAQHVVVRGGSYSGEKDTIRGYGIYVNGKLNKIVHNGVNDLQLVYLYARQIAINFKQCSRVDQAAIGDNWLRVINKIPGVDRDWWPGYLEAATESLTVRQTPEVTDCE